MDETLTIEHNRQALTRILAALVAMAGAKALPRRLRNAVLRLLRPAESATRRLVVVLAQTLVVDLPAPRVAKPKPVRRRRHFEPKMLPEPKAPKEQVNAHLPLTDRARRFGGRRTPKRNSVPRISFGFERQPIPPRPTPFDLLDPRRLTLRLNALGAALADLPKQALRLARWRARQAQRRAQGQGGRSAWRAPLRFGRPPGALRRPVHEVHEVLAAAHALALAALEKTDTS